MQLKRWQRGISLVEVMLGMTVAIAMTMVMAKMQVIAGNDLRAKVVAEAMQSFQLTANNYLRANRAAILDTTKTGTGAALHCVVGAAPETGLGGAVANNLANRTCSLDVNWLIWKKFAPAGLRTSNSYSQPIYIVYRLVDVVTEDFEVLIVGGATGSELTTSIEEATLAATIMGGNGGFIPSTTWGTCLTTEACGTNGGWRVTLASYISAPVTAKLGSVASYTFIPK